jgi:uncharacterized lipoprotein YajG
MNQYPKIRITAALLLAAAAAITLPGCSSPPKLAQVESTAPDKPINTPEMAATLKQQHER